MTEKTLPTMKKKASKKLTRTAGGHFAPKNPLALVTAADLPQAIRVRLALVSEMKKYGFKNSEVQGLLREMYREVLAQKGTVEQVEKHLQRAGVTQMVPISNIRASSLTPNFDSIQSHFVTRDAKHPDFKKYLAAEEIGDLVGMKADSVKYFIKQYCNDKGHDLPNNDAGKHVVADGSYFRGLSKRLDERLVPVHFNEKVGGVACWYLMEDGHIVWRNYWSPEAARAIIELIPAEKMTRKLTKADLENLETLGHIPQTRESLNPFGNGLPPPGPPDAPPAPPGNKVG